MGIRTGQQYLDGLRDDREIWCDGERVKEVTTDPRFAGGAKTLAELYDLQHTPDLIDQMTYESPSSGDRVGLSFIQPRSSEDLVARRKMFKIWNDYTCGMFGRSPDFINVMFSSYAAAHEAFDTEQSKFGKNMVAYYEFMRENDLASTHALVSPQVDRSKAPDAQEKDIAARIVGDNDKGFIINGVRMLATPAAISNEVMVMPAQNYPLTNSEEAKDHAFGFSIPMATPRLKFIARPSVVHQNAGSPMDYPLSERFDDSDCMILFDNVLVPWERTFIYRDIEACIRTSEINAHPGPGCDEAVLCGDMMHHMIQCHLPDWSTNFCTNQAATRATRRAFLERYADTDTLIYPAHFPAPTGSRIEATSEAFTFRYIGG